MMEVQPLPVVGGHEAGVEAAHRLVDGGLRLAAPFAPEAALRLVEKEGLLPRALESKWMNLTHVAAEVDPLGDDVEDGGVGEDLFW